MSDFNEIMKVTNAVNVPSHVPGTTGILLYTICVVIFVFAHPLIRKKAFNFFWITHQLYIFLYIFSLLHGLARLTAEPR